MSRSLAVNSAVVLTVSYMFLTIQTILWGRTTLRAEINILVEFQWMETQSPTYFSNIACLVEKQKVQSSHIVYFLQSLMTLWPDFRRPNLTYKKVNEWMKYFLIVFNWILLHGYFFDTFLIKSMNWCKNNPVANLQQELMYLRTTCRMLLSELMFSKKCWAGCQLSQSLCQMWRAAECASLFSRLLFNSTHSVYMNVQNMFLYSAFVAIFLAVSVYILCQSLLSPQHQESTHDWALHCRDNGGVLYHRECVELYFLTNNHV